MVEDDAAFGAALERGLETHGMDATWVRDAGAAYRAVQLAEFDALVVDWMLPDHDGPWLIGQLRALGVGSPVMMLTARDAIEDRVHGLDAGADDYLVKPFHLDELLARLRALVRRPAQPPDRRLGLGPLVVDTESRTAVLHGRRIDLTPSECAILEALLLHMPGAATRNALAHAIESADGVGTAGSIETHMSRLRAKIRDDSIRVRTLRGLGYRIEEDR